MEESNIKKILVFRVGHLGDTIISLRAFWSIRESFPKAHIALLSNADPKNKEYVASTAVLPPEGLFDEVIAYENAAGLLGKVGSYSKLFLKLRSIGFDSLFYLMPRLRDADAIKRDVGFFRKCGIREIHGADYLERNALSFDKTRPLPSVEKEGNFLLELLEDSGIKPGKTGCDLGLTEREKVVAENWISVNCPSDSKLVAVAPGTKWASKKWPERSFEEILKTLRKEFGTFPVFFGGPEDRPVAERMRSRVGVGAVAAGELNVRVGTAAMENFSLYLGNDTGTMHMAAAAGVRCVAVFAAIDFPGRWYPLGEGHRVFRESVECEGCHTPDCFNEHLCLMNINPEYVLDACREVLANNSARSN